MSEEVKKVEVEATEATVVPEETTEVVVPVATAVTESAFKLNEVGQKLAEYGADEETISKIVGFGVESIDDLKTLSDSELANAGMKLVKARKLLSELNAEEKASASVESAEQNNLVIQAQVDRILPEVPDDGSWLNALKTGGVLKVGDSTYIAAIRAALANRAGLFDVPDKLVKAMEKYADETEEQLDPIYFKLKKSLTRHNYADVFSAIDGLDSTYVSDKRRAKLYQRMDDKLWPAIEQSFIALDSWCQSFNATTTSPNAIFAFFNRGLTGANVIQIPDMSGPRDASDSLKNAINSVFSGDGVYIASALACDANNIIKTIKDPALPAMLGAKNCEQMLKKINTTVDSNYARMEQNLVKYVLGFTKLDEVTSDEEVNYLTALWSLGRQIDWTKLGMSGAATKSIDGKRFL